LLPFLFIVHCLLIIEIHMPLDLDEVRPNRFLIHNVKAKMLLRGEGVTVGNHFELTDWRREGWLARLRNRGFRVRTIDDRIAALPPLPEPVPHGEMSERELQHPKERYARFDLHQLRWIDVQPADGTRRVQLGVGWVLRRRRGRGHADHYLATVEKPGHIGLLPLSETDALLMGYAQATADGERTIRLQPTDDGNRLPLHLLIPPPHREVLKAISVRVQGETVIPPEGMNQAQLLFQTLRLMLQADPDER
jgi:hypothetical protein